MARHGHLRAFFLTLGHDFDRYAIALFDLHEVGALFVEEIDRRFGAGGEPDDRSLALGRFVFDQAKGGQACRRCSADEAGPIAVWTITGGRFEHAGA